MNHLFLKNQNYLKRQLNLRKLKYLNYLMNQKMLM
jgi:hypothetical protein